MNRLTAEFFVRHPVDCARDLIGATFEWSGCSGRVVETEAYAATGDEACHTFFKPSAREFVASHTAGTAYVYLNYGVHWLFNLLVKGPQGMGFVLFRALDPQTGIERMKERRGVGDVRSLCSGPGKLTRALGIDGASHGLDFLGCADKWLALGESRGVAESPRVGISRSRELPWRFREIRSFTNL